jgi:TPR repeat protein
MELPDYCRRAAHVALLLVALVAGPAPAADRVAASADPLEPAKASIRVKDYGAATTRLTPLSEAGNPQAQYLLGTLYLAGLGAAPDEARARQLFETAGAMGEPRAAFAVAALLATGDPPDPAAARAGRERAEIGRAHG